MYSAAAEFAPDDKLTGAYVGLIPESGKKVFELYSSVKSYLTARYGKPESDYAFFKSPYHQGGGQNNVWAVIEGKCVFTAFWTVYHHEKPITISIDITSDQQVELSFVNEGKDRNICFTERRVGFYDNKLRERECQIQRKGTRNPNKGNA